MRLSGMISLWTGLRKLLNCRWTNLVNLKLFRLNKAVNDKKRDNSNASNTSITKPDVLERVKGFKNETQKPPRTKSYALLTVDTRFNNHFNR